MSEEPRGESGTVCALGEHIYRLLRERMRRAPDAVSVRQSEREPWTVGVSVSFEDSVSPLPGRRILEVTTLNVSAHGLSFLADRFIQRGAVVEVRFRSLPESPRVTGIVRFCEYLGGSCHRVGVEYVGDEGS